MRPPSLLIVGAGLTGLTLAREFVRLNPAPARVQVIDRRPHIGGNAYTTEDPATGIIVHRYGTHILHTSNPRVKTWLRPFLDKPAVGGLTAYRHQVTTVTTEGHAIPLPLSLGTINAVRAAYGLRPSALTPQAAAAWIADEIDRAEPGLLLQGESAEARAISLVGPTLYRAVIRGYTAKQWGRPPAELPAEIITRLPVRLTYDTDYFPASHRDFQGQPGNGYTPLCQAIADHPRITVSLGLDHLAPDGDHPWTKEAMARDAPATPVIFTGPIDAYFNHALGALEWRSIRLEFQTLPLGNAQGAAVINYQSPRIPYTRVHEFRHLHPERDNPSDATVIAQEYSYATDTTDPEDLPYYPVRTERNLALLRAYRARATAGPPPWPLFAGRLGSYLYLDMDMAIAAALSLAERLWGGDPHRSDNPPPSVRLMEEAAGHASG